MNVLWTINLGRCPLGKDMINFETDISFYKSTLKESREEVK